MQPHVDTSCHPDWIELERRGFLVLRSFLSPEEIARLVQTYDPENRSKLRRHISMVAPPNAVAFLREKISRLLPTLHETTKIRADLVATAGIFLPTEYTSIGWHTDYESFFLFQDHYHLLNFWIPIVKPEPHKSGLTLVPMDRLEASAPGIYKAVLGRGASRVVDGHLLFEGEAGTLCRIPCPNLDDLAESPEVRPGDVIVARCDVLHRTQDTETKRIALTLRVFASAQRLDMRVFLNGSRDKHRRMLEYSHMFGRLLASFWLGAVAPKGLTIGKHFENIERFERGETRAKLVLKAANTLLPAVLWSHRMRQRLTKKGVPEELSVARGKGDGPRVS